MRAPGHPQGCFLTEILMDELADRVRMDPVEFRIKNLPPASAEREVGRVLRASARKRSAGTSGIRPAIATPGPIKTGFGCVGAPVGRRRPRHAGALRHHHRRQRRDEVRHAGSRHRHADDRRDGRRPRRSACRSARSSPKSATRTIRSAAGRAAARQRRRDRRRFASRPARRSTRCARRSRRALGVEAANARGRERPHPRQGQSVQGHGVEGRLQADRHRADLGRRRVGRRALVRPARAACSSPKSTVDIETGIVKVKRILTVQDCGLIVDRLTAESQVYGGIIGSLNFALFEDRILDRNTGQMVNPNMELYLLAGMSDIPQDRHAPGRLAGAARARRHRHRRAADRLDVGGDRQRGPQRDGRRRFAACRCIRTGFCRRIEQQKAGGTL